MSSSLYKKGTQATEKFQKLLVFENWAVCSLKSFDFTHENNLNRVECHLETDEIFILTNGSANLYIYTDSEDLNNPEIINLIKHQPILVSKLTWHAITMTPESTVIIIEKDNTCRENSSYVYKKS